MAVKIAVIGTGAAAFGIFEALKAVPSVAVDVFDGGSPRNKATVPDDPPSRWSLKNMADVYRHIRMNGGRGLPLPKSLFGDIPNRLDVDGKPTIWISDRPGGLTNFWGGTMLPFRQEDIDDWSFAADELSAYYGRIAEAVGVAGKDDGLSELFGMRDVTRPPITAHPKLDKLASLGAHTETNDYSFSMGINRTALETRSSETRACVNCGECLIGCFKDATFSAHKFIRLETLQGNTHKRIREYVNSIDPDNGFIFTTNRDMQRYGPYDKIFVAAGCLGTSLIFLRSQSAPVTIELGDSFSVNVPLLSFGVRSTGDFKSHFGLANALLIATDRETGRCVAQAQIYPTVAHFWRSAIPSWLWPPAALPGNILRKRLHWVRMYLPEPYVTRYRIQLDSKGDPIATKMEPEGASSRARHILNQWQRSMKGSGFRLLMPFLTSGGTSAHYAASLNNFRSYGVQENGRWGQRAVICDSSVWPETPVQSPTFTIMANAMRLAEIELNGS